MRSSLERDDAGAALGGDEQRRLNIIGYRPGRLIDTVHTELNLLARKHPDLADRGRVVLSGIAPEDRTYDCELVVIRQALGRLVSLGWPRRQSGAAVRLLEKLRWIGLQGGNKVVSRLPTDGPTSWR